MTTNLNPVYRTIRLAYRATQTDIGQDVLAGIAFLAFIVIMYFLLAAGCVALHDIEACSH